MDHVLWDLSMSLRSTKKTIRHWCVFEEHTQIPNYVISLSFLGFKDSFELISVPFSVI